MELETIENMLLLVEKNSMILIQEKANTVHVQEMNESIRLINGILEAKDRLNQLNQSKTNRPKEEISKAVVDFFYRFCELRSGVSIEGGDKA